jgi:hypothetical protein
MEPTLFDFDSLPITFEGHLNEEPVPGNTPGTAFWRLVSTHTERITDQVIMPCTTSDPEMAYLLLNELEQGDLLRVTGHLILPNTAAGTFRLQIEALEVLWEAPTLGSPEDTDTATDDNGPDADRNSAIHALADALTGLGWNATPGPGHSIRLYISPNGARGDGLEHCKSISITPARAHKLADAIDALNASEESEQPQPETTLNPEALKDLEKYFNEVDFTALTGDVLNGTRPENRAAVTQAMDDLLPAPPGTEDTDQ